MAADQERADRIRQLKADHPEIRWRMVGEYVGVTERAAQEWQKTGGIEPANAKKLAELFEVSYEWLWFGREFGTDAPGPTPDLIGSVDRVDGHIDRMADEFRGYVNDIRQDIADLAATIQTITDAIGLTGPDATTDALARARDLTRRLAEDTQRSREESSSSGPAGQAPRQQRQR